jgi:hypothetical protein
MKQLKKFIIAIFSLGIIVFAFYFFYQKSISNNLNQRNKSVTEAWNNFNSDLAARDRLLITLTSENDSLKYWLRNSNLERNKKENNLYLVFYEYKINEYVMTHFPNQNQISNLSVQLNNDVSKYNSLTQEYNVYISTFPIFLIAKNRSYHRAKYFEIKYGRTNEDPIQKSKEMPEWAKGVDTF